jgi:hypothetical protein
VQISCMGSPDDFYEDLHFIPLDAMYELTPARPRSIAQIHPADPLSLTAALQGVHPVSLNFVADPLTPQRYTPTG